MMTNENCWLSVIAANGEVIHETWHIGGPGDLFMWEGNEVATPANVLFAHVHRLLHENLGSTVVGVYMPAYWEWVHEQDLPRN